MDYKDLTALNPLTICIPYFLFNCPYRYPGAGFKIFCEVDLIDNDNDDIIINL